MSVYDKRVTRDMRMMMLKIHNDLKDIKNTVEECNDMWLSDLRKMEEIIHSVASHRVWCRFGFVRHQIPRRLRYYSRVSCGGDQDFLGADAHQPRGGVYPGGVSRR